MHLGRFHKTIYDLTVHFRHADLIRRLEEAASALDGYASSRADEHLKQFKKVLDELLVAAEVRDEDLEQPYAREVIGETGLGRALAPALNKEVNKIVRTRGFDHVGIAADLRTLSAAIKKKIDSVTAISKAFTELDVEYEFVDGEESEAEVGLMLPREVVGETIPDLAGEFNKLGKLFRAINELTGADDYDPRVRTISSSSWQIFLDMGPEGIAVVIIAIERIVNLFKTNLEIKNLQNSLAQKEMPKHITDLIEQEIDKRVSTALESLSEEIVQKHSKGVDEARLNELRNQLHGGLKHLAHRLNQGAQVEINVGVPELSEKESAPLGADADPQLVADIESKKARIATLRKLRTKAIEASSAVKRIEATEQGLLKYFSDTDSLANAPEEQQGD